MDVIDAPGVRQLLARAGIRVADPERGVGLLVTCDHHTSADGLEINLGDVDETGSLLAKLNTIGAELELFYCDADT